MVSVMILDGVYSGLDERIKNLNEIYIPLLTSMLRYNGIRCETVRMQGLEKYYGLFGRSKENLIYTPKIEVCKNGAEGVSFIYTDATSSVSPSFRTASVIRELRTDENGERVVFVEQLKDSDILKNYTPILVDNIRIPEDFEIKTNNSYVFLLARTATAGICRCFGLDVGVF